MSINGKKVLVTGARAPVSLHLCRILKEAGAIVYAGDSVSYALSKSSNSIQSFFLLPSPRLKQTDFIEKLKWIIQEHGIDLLIPTCEESFYIARHKEALSSFCQVFVGDFEDMKLLHNKHTFINYLPTLGIQIPKSVLLTPEKSKEDIAKIVPEKVVLKRCYSRFSDDVLFYQQAKDVERDFYDESEWLLQEKIEGKQFCSYGIAYEGKLIAHSVYPTEYTAGAGATIAFRPVEREDIEYIVETIVADLGFTGQISFDFIVNKQNIAYPIECNPRATSGLHLFDGESLNTIRPHGNSRVYPPLGRKEAMKTALLLYAWPSWRKYGFRHWLKTWKEHDDISWKRGDMKPFLYQIISLSGLWLDSVKHKNNLLKESTYDIRWDGEEL